MLTTLNLAAGTVIAAPDSSTLVTALRNFIGPLFLFAIGIAALSFLFQRQTTQFLQFFAIAVGVAVFFYAPGVVPAVAELISKAFGVTSAPAKAFIFPLAGL